MDLKLPPFSKKLFDPYRYKALLGGRGSSKSWTAAQALLIIGKMKPTRILCGREFQSSISESVHKLLADQIYRMGLQNFYYITNNKILGKNGTEFIFKGIKQNISSIKSTEGVDILWLEEAQTVSKTSWDVLIPTIRKPNSEIWCTYNPEFEDDPTHVKFVDERGDIRTDMPHAYIAKVNWRENPWFPDVLNVERLHLKRTDPDLYEHVWEGGCRKNSHAQIMKGKWRVEAFDVNPEWHGPYQGADWGFSKDPTTLIRLYINQFEKKLMIRNEAWGLGVELDDIPAFFKAAIPDYNHYMIKADCSRPETISYISRKGIPIEGANKWKGSVEDGIDFIKSFNEIIIHPDCPRMADEAKNYSFKVDKLTDEVLRAIVKKHDHCFDAARYSLDGLITQGGNSILNVL